MALSSTLEDVAFYAYVVVLFVAVLWFRVKIRWMDRDDPLAIQLRALMRRPPLWLRIVAAALCLLIVALGALALWMAHIDHAVGSYRRVSSPGHFWLSVAIWVAAPVLSIVLFSKIVRSMFR
jgi:hypothetical protein